MIFYATFFLYVGKKYIYTLASLQFFPQCSSNVSVLSLCLKMEFVQQKCPSISAQFLYFQKKIKMVSPAPQGCHDAINDLIFFFLNPEQSRAFFFQGLQYTLNAIETANQDSRSVLCDWRPKAFIQRHKTKHMENLLESKQAAVVKLAFGDKICSI